MGEANGGGCVGAREKNKYSFFELSHLPHIFVRIIIFPQLYYMLFQVLFSYSIYPRIQKAKNCFPLEFSFLCLTKILLQNRLSIYVLPC